MEELSGLDARFLYSETPRAHMHTMKVVLVDVRERSEVLTPAVFGQLLAERLDRLPGLRRVAVAVPWHVSHPVWVERPVDVADHLRWRTASPPGDRDALAAVVAEVAATPLSRDRPLWDLTVVDGLPDGHLAFVVKLHHAVADGMAAEAMLENVFRGDGGQAVIARARPEDTPDARRLGRDAFVRRLQRAVHLPGAVLRTVRGLAAARRVRRAHGERLPGLFAGRRSPLNVALSEQRTYGVTALSMDQIHTVRHAHGATVNDVFLAVCGGALRSHLGVGRERRADLVAGVPIAGGDEKGRLSGNHLDNMLVALRTDLADPVERLDAIGRASASARQARIALGVGVFEERAGHTPPHLYPLALRMWAASRLANHLRPPINLIVSNVAGPREPLELDGGRVAELWSVGPILEGVGLNITAWSYDGTLYVSALGCPESLPDPRGLLGHMEIELAALLGRSQGEPDRQSCASRVVVAGQGR